MNRDIEMILHNLVDDLAAIEHERWAHWQRYVHTKGTKQPDGSILLSAELVERWERQIQTPFHALSEREKESDRDQVNRYLPVIKEALRQD